MLNIVAIVGRPNVGKSTFFNRLIESRSAITDPTAGTTRDRRYGEAEWNGKHFVVVDTGGYVQGSEDVFEAEIRKQVKLAIDEADSILFLVDIQHGITGMDQAVADMLRKAKKPVYLVANKVDSNDKEVYAAEFYSFGLGEVHCISAQSGAGTGDLLDEVVKGFAKPTEEIPDDRPKIAIVGKPNVGKSSLVNTLLGVERNIVTPVAGTTRDNVNTRFTGYGFDVTLLDTAGIRRKSKVDEDIEFYSVLRSVRAIEESDVCMLLIDAQDGIQHQDQHIFSMIEKGGKGIVVVVNKWDLLEKDTRYGQSLRRRGAPQACTVQRLAHRVHLGNGEAAHPQGPGAGHDGLREPCQAHYHKQTERRDAAGDRALAATDVQGKERSHQVRDTAARRGACFRLLLQPAAVCKGELHTVPGE
jgi:GTP-binding protein